MRPPNNESQVPGWPASPLRARSVAVSAVLKSTVSPPGPAKNQVEGGNPEHPELCRSQPGAAAAVARAAGGVIVHVVWTPDGRPQ